jgi:predicted RNA binding protein YcfA (HicA-like mRNA interferase family)
MRQWPSVKAKRVLAALLRLGWETKRQTGSHRTLTREGWSDVVFAFRDGEDIGPRMLARMPSIQGFGPKTCKASRGRGSGRCQGLRLAALCLHHVDLHPCSRSRIAGCNAGPAHHAPSSGPRNDVDDQRLAEIFADH